MLTAMLWAIGLAATALGDDRFGDSLGLQDGGVQVFGHDPRGNISTRLNLGHAYNSANQLVSISSGHRFEYDGHGRRTVSWRPGGGGKMDVYDAGGVLRYTSDSRWSGAVTYLHLGRTLVAERFLRWDGTGEELRYVHTDVLGSPVLRTDRWGNVVERERFTAYGQPTDGSVREALGFTGHMEDPALGLTYMQQRYYDPAIGRFLSVDPVGPLQNPINHFGRYHYAANNPYRFIDPDGRLSRGTGWTDRQWRNFDRAQQNAAKSLERGADKINTALESGKGMRGVERAFERAFGAGSATPENMAAVASDMTKMASALRDTSSSAIPAHGMTTSQLDSAFGGSNATTLAAVPRPGPAQVLVNTTHADFGVSSKLSWAAGHETAHAVLGYRDASLNGVSAYKYGSPDQIQSFRDLPSAQRLTNPDHLMDFAK